MIGGLFGLGCPDTIDGLYSFQDILQELWRIELTEPALRHQKRSPNHAGRVVGLLEALRSR